MIKEPKEVERNDYMIVNTVYLRPQKIDGTWYSDCLLIVYKENGVKKFKIIDAPKFSYYVTKKEFQNDKEFTEYASLLYVPEEKVDKVVCEYQNLAHSIIDNLPPKEKSFYSMQRSNGVTGYRLLQGLHKSKYVHGSDFNIEDYYYNKIITKYGPTEQSPSKAFFDIEVNASNINTFASELHSLSPVSHISIFFEGIMYTYLLKFNDIEESANMTEETLQSYKEEAIERQGKFGLKDVKFFLYEAGKELQMIKDYFSLVNELKPDIICAWNLKFDIRYLLNRISVLTNSDLEVENSYGNRGGFNRTKTYKFSKIARQSILPEEFRALDYVMYSEDVMTRKVEDSSSYFKYAGYSTYIDMLTIYQNMTKSSKRDSYALDAISEEDLDDHKDHFIGEHGETLGMIEAILQQYRKFTQYNLHDVMLIKRLDEKTKYQDIVWGVSQITSTRIHKAMKKTVCLKNFSVGRLKEAGIILSNNRNSSYSTKEVTEEDSEVEKEDLKGAFVADPNLNEPVGIQLTEDLKSSFIFDNVIDEDIVSMYPKLISAFNIDASLQLGLITVKEKKPNLNVHNIVSSIIAEDWITLGNVTLELPTIAEMVNELSN